MYMCVYSVISRYSGQVQSVEETGIVPGCGTCKFFKRSSQKLTQLTQNLSQSCHSVRSTTRKLGAETKKVLKVILTVEEESVLLDWETYCCGDDGTRTWSVREQDEPITVPVQLTDPFGR